MQRMYDFEMLSSIPQLQPPMILYENFYRGFIHGSRIKQRHHSGLMIRNNLVVFQKVS